MEQERRVGLEEVEVERLVGVSSVEMAVRPKLLQSWVPPVSSACESLMVEVGSVWQEGSLQRQPRPLSSMRLPVLLGGPTTE